MNRQSLNLVGLFALGGWITAQAQLPGVIQQVDSVQQREQLQSAASLMIVSNAAPEFYPGETSDVGPQTVVQYPRHTHFEASVDEQYFYCDNVFLAHSGRQSSDILVSTLNFAFTPSPVVFAGGTLSPRIGYQHQWFNYGLTGDQTDTVFDYQTFRSGEVAISKFDFNSAMPFIDATWKRGDWTATFGVDARWLLDSTTFNEFYHEFVPNWSVGRTFLLSGKASVYVGYQGDYRFSWSFHPPFHYNDQFNDRTDQGVLVAGTWWLCDHAALQPYYRFQYSCYSTVKRHDRLHSVGVTLLMPVTPNIILRGFVGYDNMNTDGFFSQNYENLNAGGGLNLSVRF